MWRQGLLGDGVSPAAVPHPPLLRSPILPSYGPPSSPAHALNARHVSGQDKGPEMPLSRPCPEHSQCRDQGRIYSLSSWTRGFTEHLLCAKCV